MFAVVVLTISAISFPLLLDRDVGAAVAVFTSIRVVLANPISMALWGLIVAALLVAGSLPFFLGLTVVMPVLGHATWHLYRKAVVSDAAPRAEYQADEQQRPRRYAADFPPPSFRRGGKICKRISGVAALAAAGTIPVADRTKAAAFCLDGAANLFVTTAQIPIMFDRTLASRNAHEANKETR